MKLKGKNILFISASFFAYEKEICKKLSEKGAIVDFFDERPSNSYIAKGIIRVNRRIYQKNIDRYYRNILKKINNKKYDYFLLIKGESIPIFFLQKLREHNLVKKSIFYAYDSLDEYPQTFKILHYFEEKFTFDHIDSQKYNLKFRPLFFIPTYQEDNISVAPVKFDLSFIGTAHSDRYLVGERVKNVAKVNHISTYFYYYAMGKFAFKLRKIFDKNMKNFDGEKVNFQKLSHHQIKEIYNQSKAILDINKPLQRGLTIRTFEVLAMKKKLITTNFNIKNYPFYHPNNVLIIDREDVMLPKDFFERDLVEINSQDFYMMSLDSWIECIFINDQKKYWNIKL